MFVTLKINADLPQGSLVCHDSAGVWRQATSADLAPLGVLREATFFDDEGARWGVVVLAGSCFARASGNIVAEGGWLGCDDQGRAKIIASEECGLIAPVSRGGALPSPDDLILIFLR